MDANAKCPKCKRPDCGLLADVIIGRRNYLKAAAECFAEQAHRAPRKDG